MNVEVNDEQSDNRKNTYEVSSNQQTQIVNQILNPGLSRPQPVSPQSTGLYLYHKDNQIHEKFIRKNLVQSFGA